MSAKNLDVVDRCVDFVEYVWECKESIFQMAAMSWLLKEIVGDGLVQGFVGVGVSDDGVGVVGGREIGKRSCDASRRHVAVLGGVF
jgi:hypothetical protein